MDSLDDPERNPADEPADPMHQAMDETLVTVERQHLIRRAIELLPDQCRLLIKELFYRDDPAPYTEISRQLGMPVASIGPTRGRCLDKLKEALKKNGFF